MDSKKVSLVIGSYNPNLEWLKEAIASADFLFDEIILVDDGSAEPIPDFPRVKKIRHETNKGFYQARNTGIKNSQYEIIASLDDDDLFNQRNVIELRKFVNKNDSDIWHFPIMMFGEQSGEWGSSNTIGLPGSNVIPSGSWFKKSVWEKLGGFQYPLAEDWDFWARAKKKGMKFTFFQKPVYQHRMRKGSLSNDWVGEKLRQIRDEIFTRYEKA